MENILTAVYDYLYDSDDIVDFIEKYEDNITTILVSVYGIDIDEKDSLADLYEDWLDDLEDSIDEICEDLEDTYEDLTVSIDGTVIPAAEYTYTGGVLTLPNDTGTPLSLPAATVTTDPVTGATVVTPSALTITVTGTL